MYFIGQTRFSLYLPKSNAWNVSNFTEEEYIAHLFSDERMSVRAKIFAELSVPLMAKMKQDFDFKHIVSYSSILPEKWKNMLFELSQKYPFLHLCEVDTHQGNPIRAVLNGKPNGSVAFFRLDDDDLLAVNYLEQLAAYNKIDYKNMAVSFGKGFTGYYKDGHFIDFRDCKQRFIAIGQAYIGFWGDGSLELPTMHSHHNLDENYPVIVDSRKPSYIHTHHDQQDTNYRFSNDSHNKNNTIETDLMRFTKTKMPEVISELFPVLSDDVQGFIDNRKMIFKTVDVALKNKTTTLEINYNPVEKVFECAYEIQTDNSITSSKALVLSIFFDQVADGVQGLNQSTNPEIGWYKYLSASNGIAKGSFSFSVSSPLRLKSAKTILWDNRITTAEIKKLEIFS
ncbi:glycosyltransferase [Testudinibacter sp. P17/SS/0325]|uniref:glycosyltransferase n=1 Tax=Testudinibacter sp. TW-1 TaxID=3417757 RepID=UPI003D361BDA